ncbi:MaoC family dehydratase [Microvirga guangxiensis]|uniref:Acyl dehydratase n=1 Tax=Microvirga guangxiensis TaxID=549386 RepID=A0A1G5LAE9_9HYPH|nr:MaoC family dehydratase [Microvirga guangxiensis]SCZ09308.1 Acyl dehydratase [Microvirga guangxiensis]
MPRYAFEDFTPGSTQMLGPYTVTKEALLAFAQEYDAQPFHVDEVAAKDSFIGTLIASGWHTCSLNMRLLADDVILHSTSMGSPGIEEVKWLKPVRPGDTLRSRMTILESRPSKSRPSIGLVRFQFEMLNQADEVVFTQKNWIMFGRRDAEPVKGTGPNVLAAAASAMPDRTPERELPHISSNPYFEDLVIGETEVLGSYRFEADDIITFARQFDPQRFHVDAEAAKDSLFGALCASGWHTASVWMKQMVGYRNRIRETALARGARPARLGPSPGFTNLKWLKPVYAGDTITYRTTVTAKRVSNSRPGWGLVFHHNSGINQHGEEVFCFEGMVFWERRR